MSGSEWRPVHAARFELFTSRLYIVLVGGLAASGRFVDAMALADKTAQLIDAKGYTSFLPEILRLRGSILVTAPELGSAEAEEWSTQALELSRVQGSRVWELRIATDLASLWISKGRQTKAKALLRPIVERFTESSDTADFKADEDVLATLG